jgi:hypothetical protein
VVSTTTAPLNTSFHAVIGNQIVVNSILQTGGSDVGSFSFPHINETVNFHLSVPVMDVQSPDEEAYYLSAFHGSSVALAQIEPSKNRGRFVGEIRGQTPQYLLFLDRDAVFTSSTRTVSLVRRSGGAEVRAHVVPDIIWASKCGERIIATQVKDGVPRTIWLGSDGKVAGMLEDNTISPRCSSDGRTMFWGNMRQPMALQRCDESGCRTLFKGDTGTLSLSPDDRRLAFLTEENRGHLIRWVATDGQGGGREIAVVDTGCTPVWSNERDLWIALRNGRRVTWTEFDSDTARPTGRTSAGTRDCTDRVADPAAPGGEAVKIEFAVRSQVRVLPAKYLPGR